MRSNIWRLRTIWGLFCLLSVGVLTPTHAQYYNSWSPDRVQVEAEKLSRLPENERMVKTAELMARYAVDQAWAISEPERRADSVKPNVSATLRNQNLHLIDGQISVPVAVYSQLSFLGLIVGHDVAIEANEELKMTSPLLFKPMAYNKMVSTMPELGYLMSDENASGMYSLAMGARCPASLPICVEAQQAGSLCGLMYLMAHEVGHAVAKDAATKQGQYPLEQELRADKHAVKVLKRFFRNLKDRGEITLQSSEVACMAMPVAFIELKLRLAKTSQAKQIYGNRKQQLLDSLVEHQSEVEAITELENFRGGLGMVRVFPPVENALNLVDGVSVSSAELAELRLPVGQHTLFVSTQVAAAFEKVNIRNGQTAQVTLQFLPYRSGLETQALRELEKSKQWLALFVASGNAKLSPQSQASAPYFWNAARNLRLAGWTPPRDELPSTDANYRRAMIAWQRSILPVRWDDGLVEVLH